MSIDLKIPAVGESITEVVVGEWLKAEGAWVEEDENVVVIETDKVNLEVPAPTAGVLKGVTKQTGEKAKVGDVLAQIVPGERPADAPAAKVDASAAPAAAPAAASKGPVRVTPAAQRLLAEHGLTSDAVQPSGPGGRLLKEDVLRHVAARKAAPKSSAPVPSNPVSHAVPGGARARTTERVRMSPLRRTVARRLCEAQQNAALLTTFNEIDMSGVMNLRKDFKQAYVDKYGIKLGFMSFFVKAAVEALKAFPGVNAQIDGDEIIYHNYYDIGVAIGGGKGLVVPVIRDADALSFAQIEQTIADYGRRARDNKIKLDELMGGTFSITNGGVYGSLLSTPIVNPPQSGILGMHGIVERPMAVDGEVVIRPMMYVALTYDHRIVDGREAVTFLRRIKDCVESPVRILMEI